MDIQDPVSVTEACKILNTYDRLLVGIAIEEGVQIHRKGRARYLSRNDLDKLRPGLAAWYKRPRLSELATA